MPVIVQGRKQCIVSTETLLAWKRFQRENGNAEVLRQEDDALIVRGGIDRVRHWRLCDKQKDEVMG